MKLQLVVILSFIVSLSFSQESHPSYIQANVFGSVGSESYFLEYEPINTTVQGVYYSPGGGFGLQAEYGYAILKYVTVGFNVSYRQMFVFQGEANSETGSNKTSASMSYLSVNPKVDFILYNKPEKTFTRVLVGVGPTYNLSGDLKRTENDQKYQPIEYDNIWGFEMHLAAEIAAFSNKQTRFFVGLMYHNEELYSSQLSDTEEELMQVSGNGTSFVVGVRKYF